LTLFLGYETKTGKPVKIPYFHMLITGTTQLSGKTTTLRALAKQAVEQGYKVLIFDTKSQLAEFDNFGSEIPICMRETTDSLTILGLLESIMGRKLTAQYATLTRVCENAKDFKDVLKNAKVMVENEKNGFVRDCARVLVELLSRLIQQTAEHETSTKLELKYHINRITLNKFALEGQQVIIKTAFEDAIQTPKLVVILDEASKFTPQRYRSACQQAINHYVTQGAITKNYLWLSTQYLATTSKDAMKAMDIKLLGRQSHDTECEHTLDLIPRIGEVKYTKDQIMQLRLGHFVAVCENWVKTVYICPENADLRECIDVAQGKLAPEKIHYYYPLTVEQAKKLNIKISESEEDEEETPQEETKEIVELPPEEPKFQFTSTFTPHDNTDYVFKEVQKPVPAPEKPKRKPSFTGKNLPGPLGERVELLENNVEGLRQRLMKLEESVTVDGATAELRQVQTEIRVKKNMKYITVSDEDVQGKILTLAKEGFFSSQHPLREVVKALELHRWTANSDSVKSALTSLVKDSFLAKKMCSNENVYTLAANVVFREFGT